jgi:uncharacterized protein (TIGR00299 family) protein
MQIAYFDCFSGISGDMTLAALVDVGADLSLIQAAIQSMGIGDVRVAVSSTVRNGFRGKLLAIEHPTEHVHRRLRDIHTLIRSARISAGAKDLAMRFFERLARAEAKVHGTTIDQVHFHEVGAIDSIVDMVGVAIAWDQLEIGRAYSSAVPTGTGQIRIAHGLVSVPAPATAELLVGVPIAPTQIAMEMTTPTGAAIVTELVTEFGPMPPMQVGRIGYGAGSRNLPDRPNLLRILVGNALESRPTRPRSGDSILILECNLDDIPGEQIGFAIERLWAAGALDVFTVPIQMKKNRPGTLLTVLAKPEDKTAMESILFQQTGTLGIRYRKQSRTVLPRASVDVGTPWGVVPGKVSMLPTGEINFSPEHDACSAIAVELGLRLTDVIDEVRECYYVQESQRAPKVPTALDDAPEMSEKAQESDVDGVERDSDARLGKSNIDSTISIDSVNAVFREAAFEDEFGTPPEPVAMPLVELPPVEAFIEEAVPTVPTAWPMVERLGDEMPTPGPVELPHRSTAGKEFGERVLESNSDEPDVEDIGEPEADLVNEYYRWDSSPWTKESSPASPSSLPREENPGHRPWET